ncbi:MAG: hypothetical protein KC620_05090 [Myxococcales bacterium]|nr:hypothetical protein [Myxococcales bacterium]
MSRPDPNLVARRPMAQARAGIARARGRDDGASGVWQLFTADGALDLDILHRLVEAAEAISEGQGYSGNGGETFFGTTILTLDLARAPLADARTPTLVTRLAGLLLDDARARRVVRDRLYRELARLLGPDTPADFELTATATCEGMAIRLVADLEAPLRARAGERP